MQEKIPPKAWALLALLSLIWGSSFILIKRGLLGLTPLEVGSLRILSASLFLLPLAIKNLSSVKRKEIKYLLSVGFAGSFIPAFLFAIAQTRIESSIAGVLNAITPIFTALIGIFIYGQKHSRKVFLGVIMSFFGAVILITSGSGGHISNFNFYAFYILLATVFYAFNSNLVKYHLYKLKPLTITSVSLLFVGPLAGIQLLLFTDFTEKMTNPATMSAIGYVMILGIVGTAIALIIFNRLISLTNPLFTSSVTYVIPIVSLVWGIIDGESLLFSHAIGIFAILAGVYAANQKERRTSLDAAKN